jgi:hypothetical protein
MTAIDRIEKHIQKLEHKIEKEEVKIRHLLDKCEQKKITKGAFEIKKNHIEEKIHHFKSEIGILHGKIAVEKRHLEEKKKQ